MEVSVGKPVLALLSAACIATSAGTPGDVATAIAPKPSPTALTAAYMPVELTASTTDLSTVAALLTFPYHNIYGVTLALANAANTGLQVVLLPVSVAGLMLQNKPGDIPAYLATVQKNVANAIPNIVAAIESEIAYDQALFGQLFGGAATVTAAAAAAPVDGTSLALQLLTFPYHNVYGVSMAVAKGVNTGLQVLLLPVSVAGLLLQNKPADIPAYLDTVQKNVASIVPDIVGAIQNEIGYDQQLFSQLLSGATSSPAPAAAADPVKVTSLRLDKPSEPVEPVETQDALPTSDTDDVTESDLKPDLETEVEKHGETDVEENEAPGENSTASGQAPPSTVAADDAEKPSSPEAETDDHQGAGGRHRAPEAPASPTTADDGSQTAADAGADTGKHHKE